MARLIDIPPCQLSRFRELDNKLTRLRAEGATAPELWKAFDCLALLPSPAETGVGRRCWWQHLYAILERHGLAVPKATSRV